MKNLKFTREETSTALMWVAIPACMMSGLGFYISILFSMIAVALVYDKLTKSRLSKLVVFLWAVIMLSAAVHLIWHWGMNSLAGYGLVFVLLTMVALAKTLGNQIFLMMPVVAVIESLGLIIGKPLGMWHYAGFITDCSHLSVFMILFGVLVAPQRFRFWLLCLASPALVLSGSEEGLALLGILFILFLVRGDFNWRWCVPVCLSGFTLLMMLQTGLFEDIYPALTNERITSGDPQQILHGRWDDYQRVLDSRDYLFGVGWTWSIAGSIPHNVPLLIASHYGLLAAVAWVGLMIYGFFKTKYRYIFLLILAISMIEHYPWTFMFIIPFLLLGIDEEGNSDLVFRSEVYQCRPFTWLAQRRNSTSPEVSQISES